MTIKFEYVNDGTRLLKNPNFKKKEFENKVIKFLNSDANTVNLPFDECRVHCNYHVSRSQSKSHISALLSTKELRQNRDDNDREDPKRYVLHYVEEDSEFYFEPGIMSDSEREAWAQRRKATRPPNWRQNKGKTLVGERGSEDTSVKPPDSSSSKSPPQQQGTLGGATGSVEGSSKTPSSGPVHRTGEGKTHPPVAQNPAVVTDTDTRPPHPPATGLSKKGKGTLTSDKVPGVGSTPQTTSQQQGSADHDHLRGASGSGQTSDHPPVRTRARAVRQRGPPKETTQAQQRKAQQQQAQQQQAQQQQAQQQQAQQQQAQQHQATTQRSLSTSSTRTQGVRRFCDIL